MQCGAGSNPTGTGEKGTGVVQWGYLSERTVEKSLLQKSLNFLWPSSLWGRPKGRWDKKKEQQKSWQKILLKPHSAGLWELKRKIWGRKEKLVGLFVGTKVRNPQLGPGLGIRRGLQKTKPDILQIKKMDRGTDTSHTQRVLGGNRGKKTRAGSKGGGSH